MLDTLKRHVEKETRNYNIDKECCKNLEYTLSKKDKIDKDYVVTVEALATLSKQVLEQEEKLNKLNWLISKFENAVTEDDKEYFVKEILKQGE